MRYRFDEEGVWRRQGLLWRREVNVSYRRIQDIHLTNGIIQRWLGLATISIQTAAGSATPQITIDGVLEAEALRDYLYTKMRGVRDGRQGAGPPPMARSAPRRTRRVATRLSPCSPTFATRCAASRNVSGARGATHDPLP